MSQERSHGETRPGGRTARTRAAVLAAALEELGTQGFADLTPERLARRSGVHVSTIRRRWRTVEGVVGDLLAQRGASVPVPDTGAFRTDLYALARAIADFYAVPANRNLMEAVLTGAAREPRIDRLVRDAFTARLHQGGRLVQRAAARGEVPADTDPAEVIAALGAPLSYRLLVTRGALDDRLVHTSAEAAYHAAVAGVFAYGPDDGNGPGGRDGSDDAHDG